MLADERDGWTESLVTVTDLTYLCNSAVVILVSPVRPNRLDGLPLEAVQLKPQPGPAYRRAPSCSQEEAAHQSTLD